MSHGEITFTFLGTSTSVGVPVIGCECGICRSTDPRNKRTRSSALLNTPSGNLLIDSGPDHRQQALRHHLRALEGVLYTHPHLDHITGFDDLRAYCWNRDEKLPLYGSAETLAEIERLFPWAFSPENTHRGYIQPHPHILTQPLPFDSLTITPIEVLHGSVRTWGYRFDSQHHRSLAYLPDVKTIPPKSLALLAGIDILCIDALRQSTHPTHLSISESLAISEKINPSHTYLTHLSHEIDQALENSLPESTHIAYDGLQLTL